MNLQLYLHNSSSKVSLMRLGLVEFLVAATRGFTMGNTGCFRKAHEDNSKQHAKKTPRYLSGLEDVSNKINLDSNNQPIMYCHQSISWILMDFGGFW